ncbi:hypothetical protein, partial [Microcoleus sp. B13-B4]|uniref:hypothetical protein n=1 Tax=Microcoleus sp. B13-B4 TaxID=2818651 RepID=UPI002FD07B3A
SRPSFLDGRDAHPTITIKIVSYLIRAPKRVSNHELDWEQHRRRTSRDFSPKTKPPPRRGQN